MAINATAGNVPYDLTNITGTDNILEFVREVNTLSGEWFMTGMLFAGFIITFIALKGNATTKEAFLASGFMIMIISVFFFFLEFINAGKLIIVIILFFIMFAVSFYTKD